MNYYGVVCVLKILVLIPAFNEARNLENVITDLRRNAPLCDLLVLNDCSTDDTAAMLESLKVPHLSMPVNLGIGGNVQAGYKYALENDYDIAVQFDGDGQHDAAFINPLCEPLEADDADVAIGSRFVENEGFQSSAARRAGISFLSSLIKSLSGTEVADVTSGMRAVNRRMIAMYAEEYAQDYPEPEALLLAGLAGARIREVPVIMRERAEGKSSISGFKSLYYMIKVSLALMLLKISVKKGELL